MATDHSDAWAKRSRATAARVSLRIIEGVLIGLAALLLLYIGAVNAALNSSIGRKLMNSHPDVVRIRLARAWTIWPGCVHVRDIEIAGQDSQNQFAVTAERAQMCFTLQGIRTQDVTGTHVHGDGIRIRVRRRVLQLPAAKDLARLPEIPGFPSPLKPDAPDVRVVGVRLQDIQATHIRELWVDSVRVSGELTAAGGMYYKPRREVRVYPAVVMANKAMIHTGTQLIASDLQGRIDVCVDPIDLRKLGLAQLGAVSAEIDLRGLVANLKFLHEFHVLPPAISLSEGDGRITIALQLDHGALLAGSALRYLTPKVHLTLPYFHVRSAAQLELGVAAASKHVSVEVRLGPVTVVQRSTGKEVVQSKTLHLSGHTRDLDLTRPQTLEARLDIPAVTAADVSFLTSFFPAVGTAELQRGAVTLSGHLNLSTARRRLDGVLDVHGSRLSLINNSAHLSGDAHLHGVLRRLDLDSLGMDLGGSSLALTDVTIVHGASRTQGWEGRVEVEPCLVSPGGKRSLEMAAKVQLKNLQPAVEVVAANVNVPWIARSLANQSDVRAKAGLKLAGSTLRLTELAAGNDSFSVQGQGLVKDLQGKDPHKDIFLLVKLGLLSCGIDIHDTKITPILVTPQKWFDARRAAAP